MVSEAKWGTSTEQEVYDAQFDGTDPARLHELASHVETRLRVAVAENSNLSAQTADLLAADVSDDVRLELAAHHGPRPDLFEDSHADVRAHARRPARGG